MKKSRNTTIDFLRFLFCFLIICYHFFSHYLRNIEFPNYFSRSYIGDEFFFLVSGYYFAQSANNSEEDPIQWNLKQLRKRISKIAIPYYITWLLCFIGMHYTCFLLGEQRNIILDLFNSIYELLFLEMFGFKKGLFCNDVGWYFSALLIVTFVLGPFVIKYKRKFALYIAPIIALFSYGILSLQFDYLHDPYKLMVNTGIMKGIIRACAAICLGVFLYGLVQSNCVKRHLLSSNNRLRKGVCLLDIIIWMIIIFYMVYPFRSNADALSIQYDYIAVLLMFFALAPILCQRTTRMDRKTESFSSHIGKYTFYAYLGQAVFYSVDKLVYRINCGIMSKFIILNISVFILTSILWIVDKKLSDTICRR